MSSTRIGDKKLLESGLLADVTVKCGSREWKLHKIIITTRSEWFRKALTGNFVEAKEGVVVLDKNEDPEAINDVITWLYTRDFSANRFNDENQMYAACSALYKTADFFGLDELQSDIQKLLSERLRTKATLMQAAFCKDPAKNGHFLTNEMLEGLELGLVAAYAHDFGPLQKKFVNFVIATHFWVVADVKFQKLLDRVPEFATAILKELPAAVVDGRYVPAGCPEKCSSGQCYIRRETVMASNGKNYWAKVWRSKTSGKIHGYCNYHHHYSHSIHSI
ncbi:hypothetical protein BJ170DRAFT_722747 [Xylariales sp. AK1849]|nr:hypothetical protein BJ170DRAFT_722747 [Xylariales sp. AK1849]